VKAHTARNIVVPLTIFASHPKGFSCMTRLVVADLDAHNAATNKMLEAYEA
jgi:hypothetical protein